ncbi:hypothetical protein GX51_01477 [Blastomyces parvus]|uniref:Uncharacterized protein n=1 Tax=Blastomyces parvus TaxID=2060905 RepID=A0A2B7XFW4_9EURO|nr:hypothetical protein GX51_01477 [Blastomyces parvus]
MKIPNLLGYSAIFFLAFGQAMQANAFPINPKSDCNSVSKVVNSMHKNVVQLQGSVQDYNGGIIHTIQINRKANGITNSLNRAIDVAQECAEFAEYESENLATAFLGLEPEVTTTIDVLISKEPVFRRGVFFGLIPLKKVVTKKLTTQKALASQFAQEVSQRTTPDFACVGPRFNETINTDFARALAAFAED